MPSACSPSGTCPRWPHGRSGRACRSASCRCAISLASPMSCMVCAIRSASSARCSGERPAIIRSCAAARRASESISSSIDSRVVREELAVLVHEVAELLVGVLAAVVRVEERGQVGDHVLDRLHVASVRVLQRLLHRGERAVEHLPAQQVLDLLVGLPRLVRAPRVVLERPDGAGGVVGQRVQLGLGQARGVVRIGEQLPPFGLQRLVEQLADLLQGAVHPAGRRGPGAAARAPSGAARPAPAGPPCRGAAARAAPPGRRCRPAPSRRSRRRRCPGRTAAPAGRARRASGRTGSRGRAGGCHLRPRRRCGCRRCPWPAGGSGTAPRARTRRRPRPARPTARPPARRAGRAARPAWGWCRAGRAAPAAGTSSPDSTVSPPVKCSCRPVRSRPAQRARKVCAVAWRSRCSSTSSSRSSSGSLPASANSTLPRLAGTTPGRSTTRATGRVSPATAARRTAEAATVSRPAIANRALTPERWSTWLDSRTSRVNRAMISTRCSGTTGVSNAPSPRAVVGQPADVRLLVQQPDLVGQLERVVGAHLGAEAVLERGDDPAAVGVVLGVGAGHQQQVQRQPHPVAADLDVALLQHVEQRDLDPLGEVGQLVDAEDAAVGARHQAVVHGLRVAEGAALGDLDRVDVADEVADAGVRGGQLLAVPLAAVHPADRGVVAVLGDCRWPKTEIGCTGAR